MSASNNKLVYSGEWTFTVRKSFVLDPNLSVGAKILYIAVRSFCHPQGETAFPSSLLLAKSLAIGRDTLFKYALELERAGFLGRKQSHAEAGKFSHTVYTLFDTQQTSIVEPCAELPSTVKTATVKTGTNINHTKEEKPEGNAVAEYWNSKASLSKVKALSPGRKKHLSERLKDPFWVANYKEAIDKIVLSRFCNGDNDRGWKATFDWLLRPDTIVKVMEGKYDSKVVRPGALPKADKNLFANRWSVENPPQREQFNSEDAYEGVKGLFERWKLKQGEAK